MPPIGGGMEVNVAKAGMRRPNPAEPHGTEGHQRMNVQKNTEEPVPELQGRAKAGHEKAEPVRKKSRNE